MKYLGVLNYDVIILLYCIIRDTRIVGGLTGNIRINIALEIESRDV
jgi:hypothetical protein